MNTRNIVKFEAQEVNSLYTHYSDIYEDSTASLEIIRGWMSEHLQFVIIKSDDSSLTTNFMLRELVSLLSLKVLLMLKRRFSHVSFVFWLGVHRQLICFGQFLKGRALCF
jgi:hypothetical protein